MICMDITSVPLGKSTRDMLRDYKAENGLKNYDQAILSLLANTDMEVATERPAEPAK